MTATAYRHDCALRSVSGSGNFHTSGTGKPKRKRCAGCGGALVAHAGVYGVFTWRGDGRYSLEDAISTHTSEAAADRAAWKFDPSGHVSAVRFIATEVSR